MSLFCHQLEKWNGINVWSGPMFFVIFVVILSFVSVGVLIYICSPLRMLWSVAVFGLISTKFFCISSANQGLECVSSLPFSYSIRRPEVRMIGNSLPMYLFFSCIDLKRVGRR